MVNKRSHRAAAKPSNWGTPDGTQMPIVRVYGIGSKGSVAVDYAEIPRLIAELANLLHEHQHASGEEN